PAAGYEARPTAVRRPNRFDGRGAREVEPRARERQERKIVDGRCPPGQQPAGRGVDRREPDPPHAAEARERPADVEGPAAGGEGGDRRTPALDRRAGDRRRAPENA